MIRLIYSAIFGIVTLGLLSSCSMDGLVNVGNPEGDVEVTLEYVKSRAGATGLFYSALGDLQKGISTISYDIAMLTDELACPHPTQGSFCSYSSIDARVGHVMPLGRKIFPTAGYLEFQDARISASQARSSLLALKDSTLNYLVSGSYAIEGYSILFLAENMCSGIPLSDVPFEGVVRYDAGISTNEALRKAVVLFDSALEVKHDSVKYYTLAMIGKARAYLGLGLYDSAFIQVESVADTDVFELSYTLNSDPDGNSQYEYSFWGVGITNRLLTSNRPQFQIDNFEGENGLVWSVYGANDPRVPVTWSIIGSDSALHQRKYLSGSVIFPLARGMEALMIRAEYFLNQNDPQWIEYINSARRSVLLADTTDPGKWEERVSLLFRERAHWFYLEGHRLADYRRMVRQYQMDPSLVYPSGIYVKDHSIPFYGTEFVFTPPNSEYELNYMYEGCIHSNP